MKTFIINIDNKTYVDFKAIYNKGAFRIIYNYLSGALIEKTYLNNKLHSFNDKPALVIFKDNGELQYKGWYKHGKIHRDNNLIAALQNANENDWIEYYMCDNVYHRTDDKPAIIYKNNKKFYEQHYYIGGRLHRFDDKPAIVINYPNGKLKLLSWWEHGKLKKRNNLPSIIKFDELGNEKHLYT